SLAALPSQPSTDDWSAFLRLVLAEFDCVTGTLHRLDPADNLLKLVTCERIPEALIPIIQTIPIGKGVAGAAAERKEPVELCNLQTDTSGVAKPDAKKTQVQGSLAVPVLGESGELCGTIGIGKMTPHEFTEAEKESLMSIGRAVAGRLAAQR
ncbi:MAG: histidine kinase, partial [Verrucomicrobiaceae bacterium]|nr:histidine kinase [Verrucomicrobiaceae bacterium]